MYDVTGFVEVLSEATVALTKRDAFKIELSRRQDEIARLLDEVILNQEALALLNKSAEQVKMIVEIMAERSIRKLENMLTFGVGTIFKDSGFNIEIEVNDRGKDKTATMWLIDSQNVSKAGVPSRTRLYEGNGGGLAAVASLMIRVYLMLKFDKQRFLVLDESMSELSIEFVSGFLTFLRMIVDELDFVVLMITHDTRFTSIADKGYKVKAGVYTEIQASQVAEEVQT